MKDSANAGELRVSVTVCSCYEPSTVGEEEYADPRLISSSASRADVKLLI